MLQHAKQIVKYLSRDNFGCTGGTNPGGALVVSEVQMTAELWAQAEKRVKTAASAFFKLRQTLIQVEALSNTPDFPDAKRFFQAHLGGAAKELGKKSDEYDSLVRGRSLPGEGPITADRLKAKLLEDSKRCKELDALMTALKLQCRA